jgi:hypothetical protein
MAGMFTLRKFVMVNGEWSMVNGEWAREISGF